MIITDRSFDEYVKRRFSGSNQELSEYTRDRGDGTKLVLAIENMGGYSPGLIPIDMPEDGLFGYVAFWSNDENEEQAFVLQREVWPKAQIIMCETIEEYKDAFDNAVKNDWLIVEADDTKKLHWGFVIVRGSGTTCYKIQLRTMKQRWQQRDESSS